MLSWSRTSVSAARWSLAGAGLQIPSVQAELPIPFRRSPPAPCTKACPAGINVKAYVSLIARGHVRRGAGGGARSLPVAGHLRAYLPSSLRGGLPARRDDEPIAIRALKRFVADVEPTTTPPARLPVIHPTSASRHRRLRPGRSGRRLRSAPCRLSGDDLRVRARARRHAPLRHRALPACRREVLDSEIG